MKKRITYLVIAILCFPINQIYCQRVNPEEIVNVSVYKGSFYIDGDKDTYYPVIFKHGEQNKINHLKIYRSYKWAGPDEFSPTHKGSLLLEIDVNYGRWGGIKYDWRIMDLRQLYHDTFANASFGMHKKGFIVWLRGGGFFYKYESDKPSYIQVAPNVDELIYDHSNDLYDVYAPPPITEINWTNINKHKNDHWDFIKEKPSIDLNGGIISSGNLQVSGSGLHYISNGNVLIGKTSQQNSSYKLDVAGSIRADEVKVNLDGADFVFEEGYNLKPLSEVDNFIKENKHLPDIESAKEMQTGGTNLGELNTKLLQKIEELTLYLIQQNEKIEKLEKEIAKLKKH